MDNLPQEGRVSSVLQVAGRRWLTIVAFILVVMIVTFLVSYFFLPKKYQAQVKIIYPLRRGAGFIKASLGALDIPIRGFQSILETDSTTYNHIVIMQSRTVAEMVVDELDLTNYYKKIHGKTPEEKLRRAAKRLRRAMSVNDTIKGAVVIKLKDRDPKMASDMANAVVDATGDYLIELYQETAGKMTIFLRDREIEMEQELSVIESAIRQKKEETGILSVDSQAQEIINTYAELQQLLTAAEIDYRGSFAALGATRDLSDEALAYVAAIEKGEIPLGETYSTYLIDEEGSTGIQPPPKPIVKALEDPNIGLLRKQMSEIQLELATKRIAFSNEHPDVIVLGERLAHAREALYEELLKFYDASIATLEVENIAYGAQVDVVKEVLTDLDERISRFPAEEQGLIELERKKKVSESVLLVIEQELEESEIRQQKLELPFTVLDEAIPPRRPISPRLAVNPVIAGGIAAWIIVYFVFWQEARKRREETAST